VPSAVYDALIRKVGIGLLSAAVRRRQAALGTPGTDANTSAMESVPCGWRGRRIGLCAGLRLSNTAL
jgi:hypothetical protein